MEIKLADIRRIVNEELTQHQQSVIKNSMQTAIRLAHKLAAALKHGEGDRAAILEPIAQVVRDARGWVPKMGRDYPHKKLAAEEFLEHVEALEKLANVPFGGLFKGRNAAKAERLHADLSELCEKQFKVVHYDENYKNLDDRAFNVKQPSWAR